VADYARSPVRRRRLRSALYARKEVHDPHPECLAYQMQTGDCDIHPSGFKRPHLRPMKAGKVRELILGPSAFQA